LLPCKKQVAKFRHGGASCNTAGNTVEEARRGQDQCPGRPRVGNAATRPATAANQGRQTAV